jgi:hypothetical protein
MLITKKKRRKGKEGEEKRGEEKDQTSRKRQEGRI